MAAAIPAISPIFAPELALLGIIVSI